MLNKENNPIPVIVDRHIHPYIDTFFKENNFSKIIVLTDSNTHTHCLPYIDLHSSVFSNAEIIEIEVGEEHKNLDTARLIWETLLDIQADRNSVLVNLGGGVVCDIGGFCASTFQRGISYINIPTSLMAQVDASIGGKTAINLNVIKNQVGTFYNPRAVFICPEFLKTLPEREYISGMAEVFKHALICNKELWFELAHNSISFDHLIRLQWIEKSVKIKQDIVQQDPFEKDLRKVLNVGHTIGHALETFFMQTESPLSHGEAVALGIMYEIKVSYKLGYLEKSVMLEIIQTLQKIYSMPAFSFETIEIIRIIKSDKKNSRGTIYLPLLKDIGDYILHVAVPEKVLSEVLSEKGI